MADDPMPTAEESVIIERIAAEFLPAIARLEAQGVPPDMIIGWVFMWVRDNCGTWGPLGFIDMLAGAIQSECGIIKRDSTMFVDLMKLPTEGSGN